MRVDKISLIWNKNLNKVIFHASFLASGCKSAYLSDDEQSVTTESAVLGDLFQKYVPYIDLFLPEVFE